MPKTVGVAVSNATFHFDKLYTYAVMPDQQDAVKLGSMVLVPFGRGSRARMGVVLACDAEPESAKLKYLFDVAPASACLTPELLRLVHFLKERTFCTYYEAVKAVIPYGAQYKPAVAADGVTPVLQKQLIHKAYVAGKQVITATQMLDSMIKNPRPTRAEATDVANAIYDGTSAIMLSGETAAGAYPVEAVRTMVRIAERTENDIDYVRQLEQWDVPVQKDVTSAISHATCTTAHDLGAVAIMTVSKTGFTARMISKFRPACPIISGTTDRKVLNQMGLSWGVIPVMLEEKTSTDELFEHIVTVAEEHGLVQAGDIAVITAGIPLGISGTTNMLKVHLVGDVLVSGTVVNVLSTCGPLCVCKTEEEALQKFRRGDILVLPKTTNATMPLIRQASGIVTEMDGVNSHAAIAAMALDKPAIVGAAHATDLLRSGTTVKLDGVRGAIFCVSAPSAEK